MWTLPQLVLPVCEIYYAKMWTYMFKLISLVGEGLGLLLPWKWCLYHLQASFVLCHVFVKSRARNSVSENVLGCAEETVEAETNGDDFTNVLDDPITTRPVSVGSFEFPSGIPPDLPNDMVT